MTSTGTLPAARLNYRQTTNAGGWARTHGFDVYQRSLYLGFVLPTGDGGWVNSRSSKRYPNRSAAGQALRFM